MAGEQEKERFSRQLQRSESRIVNIVLRDESQVAGEMEKATHQGILLTDGRFYGYKEIEEINGC
mgnify:CR=1 FL=1|jgi:hypothetical protein